MKLVIKIISLLLAKSSNQPFYLFCRENKKHVSAKYGQLDIEAMKRKYVELWKALPDAEKSKYKKRVGMMAQPAPKMVKVEEQFLIIFLKMNFS